MSESQRAAREPEAEPVGTLAEEAFKLLRAVSGQSSSAATASATDSTSPAEHACSTSWCPVCQVVGFVREHPDVVASVSRSAGDLTRSLRDLVDIALSSDQRTGTSPKEKQ